jgi:hypothetical protein
VSFVFSRLVSIQFIKCYHTDKRCEVFIAVKIQVDVFWIVTPCGAGEVYLCLERSCYLHLQGEDSSRGLIGCDLEDWYVPYTNHDYLLQHSDTNKCHFPCLSGILMTYEYRKRVNGNECDLRAQYCAPCHGVCCWGPLISKVGQILRQFTNCTTEIILNTAVVSRLTYMVWLWSSRERSYCTD